MANGVVIRAEAGAGIKALKGMPVAMRTANQRAMTRATIEVHRRVMTDAFGGRVHRSGLFMVSEAGNRLANRTGHSRARINSDVFGSGNVLFGVVGSPDLNVLVNEVGATITAKHGALAIPTANVLTPTGALKEEWAGVSLREVWKQRKLFVLRRKGAVEGLVARRTGSAYRSPRTGQMQRRSEPLFLLRRSVNIAARHMLRTVARQAEPIIAGYFASAAKATIEGIRNG